MRSSSQCKKYALCASAAADLILMKVVVDANGADMILMHGFVKKERRTPLADLRLARDRKRQREGTSHDK